MRHSIVATVAVCGILLSACQRKAEGQTVAVVNGEEITLPELNFALSQAKVPDNADKKTVRTQVLQQLIDRRLLAEQARSEGIDKSPEYLNRRRQAEEQLMLTMLAARRLNSAQLPSDREVQAYIAAHPGMFANRETWTLDQVQYVTPSDQKFAMDLKNAHSIDAVIALLQSRKIGIKRQKNRLDTAIVPSDLYSKLATLPAGEPFVVPVGSRSVVSAIVSKEPNPLTGDEAKPAAVSMMRKEQGATSLQGLLKSLRSSAKIEYQPGYAPPKK